MQKGPINDKDWRGLDRLIAFQWGFANFCRENAIDAFCEHYGIDRIDVENRMESFWLKAPDTLH
jgi:hypothetical protein